MNQVKNLRENALFGCKCGSWHNHLSKFGGSGQSIFCSEISCYTLANTGGQVQFENDSSWYVIALCNSHTKLNGNFEIKSDAKRARASTAETCDNK